MYFYGGVFIVQNPKFHVPVSSLFFLEKNWEEGWGVVLFVPAYPE